LRGVGTVRAQLPAPPAGASYTSIRVTATDLIGNKVRQTIEKAWATTTN
jgi:hypothetical protein